MGNPRNYSIEESIEFVSKLRQLLGEEKIKKIINEIQPTNFQKIKILQKRHPLIYNIWLFEQNCNKRKESTFPFSLEIIDLTFLTQNLTILLENQIEGIENKINQLFNPNFEKVMYELEIASTFIALNHRIKFIKEMKNKKTPDFVIIDQDIEVECKRKDAMTPRDRNNMTFKNLISENLLRLMKQYGRNYIIYIYHFRDFNPNDIKKINEIFVFLMKSGEKNCLRDKNFEICVAKTEEYDVPLGKLINLDSYFNKIGIAPESGKIDYIVYEFCRDNIRKEIMNPQIIGFFAELKSDKVKGVIDSIKKASSQIWGKNPNLIFIHHTLFQGVRIDSDIIRLKPEIMKILRNNTSISCIILTFFEINSIKDGINCRKYYQFFNSSYAKNPIKPEFFNFMVNSFKNRN